MALADCPVKGKGLFKPGQPAVVAMFVRALGKGAFRSYEGVCGNFTWLVDRKTPKPAGEMSFSEAVDLFRGMGDEWRDEARPSRGAVRIEHGVFPAA